MVPTDFMSGIQSQHDSAVALADTARLSTAAALAARDAALSEPLARQIMWRLCRDAEDDARETMARRLADGVGGLQVGRALARVRDGMIASMLDLAGVRSDRMAGPGSGFMVAALGGYGRGVLAPHSDLDLAFVVTRDGDPWQEYLVEVILYTLWDLGLTLGHGTRTVDGCIALARQDMTFRTSLLEARFLAGDPAVYDQLRERYWQDVATDVMGFVDCKLAERAERHDQEENAQYRVEPNLKEGQGGLRDLHALFWIAKYVYRLGTASDLVDAGLLTTAEFQAFERSSRFLWDVRCHLHMLAGRAEERLSFDVQQDLAQRLRYADSPGLQAVEAFMKAYFTVTREVRALTGVIFAALEMQNAKGRPRRPWFDDESGTPLAAWPDFKLDGARITVVEPGLFERDPVALLRIFEPLDARGLEIHPYTQRLMNQSGHLIDARLRGDQAANGIFLRLLTEGRQIETTLRTMNEAGVLGAFIPDFGRVIAMMQFNMYHHYTVDDHLLRTVGQLDAILKGGLRDQFPLAHRVARRVQSRRPLLVAMFLHDIAKGRSEDHSIAGERVTRSLGPRLGLTESETEAAAWLVRHHLLLNDTAQRRDIFDPKTVRDVIAVVRTRERLRMLLILTVADIKGVGPTTWTRWKGQLLEQLYLEVETALGGTSPDEGRRDRAATVRDAVEARLPVTVPRTILDSFQPSYWLSFPEDICCRHARLMAIAHRRKQRGQPFALVDIHFEADRGMTLVTVVVRDRAGLFADLLETIATMGAFLVGAKAFTTAGGIALDMFEIQDPQGSLTARGGRAQDLKERLQRRFQNGEAAMPVPVPRVPEREQAFHVPPQIFVDNEASDTATVVEVEHRHRPDLLHRVAAALRDLGLSITSAHCTHYGELAVDVFYVKNRGGLKIRHIRQLERIDAALKAALAETA
ncbi:MAG: [protein-PII] uridylyltransferase [Alphaproteobacteria bacterium]